VDDLLKTSWESCQGTDILIESPSAMGGYHIAEALGIPYYRAFTMTWTRTRLVGSSLRSIPSEHDFTGHIPMVSRFQRGRWEEVTITW